jgi:hypothetical protein
MIKVLLIVGLTLGGVWAYHHYTAEQVIHGGKVGADKTWRAVKAGAREIEK